MVGDDKDIRSNFVHIEDVREEKRTGGRNEGNILVKRRRQLQLSRECSAIPLNESSEMNRERLPLSENLTFKAKEVNTISPSKANAKNYHLASYEFNMSSNVISISFTNPTKISKGTGVVYNVSVTGIDPVTDRSNYSVNACSAGADGHENWVKLNMASDYTKKARYKCVLLVKKPSKGRYFSWNYANKKCLSLGGNLIKIQKDEEEYETQKFVTKR